MLCAIQNDTNQKVRARLVERKDGPFGCPICGKEVLVRKGQIRVHHFAHRSVVTCKYGKGESEAHRKAKESIYEALANREDVAELELEKSWGEVVSDVYAEIQGRGVAFEVQISNLTMREILYRTKAYASKGIAVLWLPLFNSKLNQPRYSPSSWEKWLHATYFGRVYYWLDGLTVIPVRYADYEIEVESSSWYNEYGEEQYAGGYSRRSRRWRKPIVYPAVQIPSDFVLRRRASWEGGKLLIPACRILLDKKTAKKRKRR
ncbi:competence protein CoiA [Pontibacterium sinense]